MSSQPKSFLSLTKLAAQFPEDSAFFELLIDTVTERNERAAVLAVVSLLEGALQKSLTTEFLPDSKGKLEYMFGSGAPLRPFSAKIRIGFALKVFGPNTRDNLDAIREVRNSFAHTMSPISFDTPEVANVCKRITILDLSDPRDIMKNAPTRSRFVTTAVCFASEFFLIAHPRAPGVDTFAEAVSPNSLWWSHFKRAMAS